MANHLHALGFFNFYLAITTDNFWSMANHLHAVGFYNFVCVFVFVYLFVCQVGRWGQVALLNVNLPFPVRLTKTSAW